MKVSIIIPTKHREEILQHSLQYAVKAIENLDAEIIVVNDGDKAILIPDEWTSAVNVVKNPKSGVASARNFGAANAKSGLLIFMDDDMLIHENAVKRAIELVTEQRTININWVYPPELLTEILQTKFGRYLHHTGFTTLKGWNDGKPWNDNELFENHGVTSQFLAIRKRTFELVDGYDETFPHAGFEDYDFAKRLKEKGIRFFVWPLDTIYHNETDRQELKSWLDRKRRGGETRKHAVLRGNKELALHYAGVKKIILFFLVLTKSIWMLLLDLLPHSRRVDRFYEKIANVLLATAIFEGYTSIS